MKFFDIDKSKTSENKSYTHRYIYLYAKHNITLDTYIYQWVIMKMRNSVVIVKWGITW